MATFAASWPSTGTSVSSSFATPATNWFLLHVRTRDLRTVLCEVIPTAAGALKGHLLSKHN